MADDAERLAEVNERLALALPEALCELDHDDAWQLLVVTILSAQARDAVINLIRPELFARWPTPAALAAAPQEEVEVVVKRSGYFRQKAKAIRECAQAIVDRHEGEVPDTHEALVALPGASHKTANLVLGIAFDVASGIVVDTHVARVSARLGLVSAKAKPAKIESQLCKLAPRETWIALSHRLILHGRHVCKAKGPDCANCAIHELCPSHVGAPSEDWRTRADNEGRLFEVRGDRAAAGWPPAPGGSPASNSRSDQVPSSSLESEPEPEREPEPVYAPVEEDEDDF